MVTPRSNPTASPGWHLCLLGAADCTRRLRAALADHPEFTLVEHESYAAARAAAAACQIDLAVVSAALAEGHAGELFGRICPARVAVVAERADVAAAVHWMRAGAVDYFALEEENLATLPERLRALLLPRPAPQARTSNLARQLVALVERAGDGLILVDARGRFETFNGQMRRITGYSRTAAGTFEHFLQLVHPEPEVLARAQAAAHEAVVNGTVDEVELAAVDRLGERRVLSVVFSPVRVAGRVWLLGAYRDNTVRRRAERALEAREARSQAFNRALAALAGDERLFHTDAATAWRTITAVIAEALAVARVGVWFYEPEARALACADLFDRRTGVHQDGCRLTAAEYPDYFAALERCETIAATDALRDPATRAFGPAYLQPNGIGALLDVPIRAGGRVVGVVCHEHVGTARVWNASEEAFAVAVGGCVSLVLEAQARRAAEAAVQAAHDRLDAIVDFLPDATFVVDAAGVVTAWNKAMETLSGVPAAAMLGRGGHEYALHFYGERRPMLVDLALHPAAAVARAAGYDLLRSEGDVVFGEAHATHLSGGRSAYLWGSARALRDSQGRVTGAIESIRDVTARRQAEAEVVAWKRRYELVTAASGQITYEYDLGTGRILWSESAGQVLGYPLPEIGGTLLRWLRLVHPQDRGLCFRALHHSAQVGAPFEAEYRMRHRDGHHRWFRDRGYFIAAEDRTRRMIGMLTDITAGRQAAEALQRAHAHLEDRVRERTAELAEANDRLRTEIAERERAQQALVANEQKYRLMVDSLPQVVYELDLRGNIVVLNREGVRTARFPADELARGVSLISLVHPDDHERLRANWVRLLAGHNVNGEEYRFLRRDGTSFAGTSYSHLILQDGHPVGVAGVLVDNSQHKLTEETLRRAQADLEERVGQRTAELAESNASLRRLLERQEMNIGLAHQVLLLVNAEQPRNTPLLDGLNLFVAAQSIPRYLEGGDHFFTRQLAGPAGPRTLVSLKDQSGHEVGCILRSIITDLVHNALVGSAGAARPLAEVVTRLNREISRSHLFRDGDFFTSLSFEIDHATLELRYVVAGHPPFLLVRGTEVRLLPAMGGPGTNPPVGMLDHHEFTAATLQLQPGDKLLLYTDGLLDAPLARHATELSSAELAEHARRLVAATPGLHAVPLANALFQAVAGCASSEAVTAHGLPDDVALVAIEIEQPAAVCEDVIRPANLAELRAQRARLVATIEEEWRRHGVTAAPMRLQVVLEEALYNAWRHGNREDPAKAIRVRRRYGNDACLEILDEGAGFGGDRVGDPTAHENRTKPSGRGLFLIRRFADEARWSDRGRHLTVHFGDEATFGPPAGRSPLPRLDLWNTQPPDHSVPVPS